MLDIRLREVGAKRAFNGTSKVNRQTDRQTQIWTFRLIESISPEGRCFEKENSNLYLIDISTNGGTDNTWDPLMNTNVY